MTSPNIASSKTEQTFKNKQSAMKRVLKDAKHRHKNINSKCCNKVSSVRQKSLANWCVVIGTLVTLVSATPASAVEIEEGVSINKPIMRNVPDLPGWVRFSPEYVRCFCNLPACVSTGYMCKSSKGGCFSDLLNPVNQALSNNVYRGIHGCVELLNDMEQRDWCQTNITNMSKGTQKKKNEKSVLHCCYHDMCNHADNPETRGLLNETSPGDPNDNENRFSDGSATRQDGSPYSESEVWFRAAIIAVPICGAVIVLALIILAIRLLRTESSQNSIHKLGMPSYMLPSDRKGNGDKTHYHNFRHHNIIKESYSKDAHHHNPIYYSEVNEVKGQSYVPLLIQDEISPVKSRCDKNETNAKLNCIQDFDANSTSNSDNIEISTQNLFYKNMDLLVVRNMKCDDSTDHQELNVDKTYSKESIS